MNVTAYPTPPRGLELGDYVVPSFASVTGVMIFRFECWCGCRSAWSDSPAEAIADRPASCKAHDEGDRP